MFDGTSYATALAAEKAPQPERQVRRFALSAGHLPAELSDQPVTTIAFRVSPQIRQRVSKQIRPQEKNND